MPKGTKILCKSDAGLKLPAETEYTRDLATTLHDSCF